MLIPVICVHLLSSDGFKLTLPFLLFAFLTTSSCLAQQNPPDAEERTPAREALTKGVQAFRDGQSEDAVNDFSRAKYLDPQLLDARLYLATALASQYIPGAPSEDNRQFGNRAVEEFKGVLQIDSGNLKAIDGIGSLLFQMAETPPIDLDLFKQSKSFHEKHIQIKPNDPEPYYWMGVIDWTLAFRANNELREKYNEVFGGEKLAEVDPLPPYLQVQYATQFGPTIDEGIDYLKKALTLKPDYDDAMAYLNLLYRRKADTVWQDDEREKWITMADDLLDKIKEIKQKRAEQQPQ